MYIFDKRIILIILVVSLCGCVDKSTVPIATPIPQESVQDAKVVEKELDRHNDTEIQYNNQQLNSNELVLLGADYYTVLVRKYLTEIILSDVPTEDGELLQSYELVKRLLSGDNSFDIYSISSNSNYMHELLKNGYYVDISTFDEMNEIFNQMFPAIVEVSTFNDDIFGMPVYVESSGFMRCLESDMEIINWSPKQITQIDDILQFNNEWIESQQLKGSVILNHSIIMDQIIFRHIYNNYDYEQQYIDLNDDSFNDVLTDVKKLYDANIVNNNDSDINSSYYVLANSKLIEYTQNAEIIPIPQTEGQNNISNLDASWLVVNPNSRNIDTAIEMFTMLAEIFKLKQSRPILYRDADYYFTCILDESDNQYNVKRYKPEFLDRVDKLYEKHQVYYAIANEDTIREVITDYLNGNIQMDKAISQAQHIIDMSSN